MGFVILVGPFRCLAPLLLEAACVLHVRRHAGMSPEGSGFRNGSFKVSKYRIGGRKRQAFVFRIDSSPESRFLAICSLGGCRSPDYRFLGEIRETIAFDEPI